MARLAPWLLVLVVACAPEAQPDRPGELPPERLGPAEGIFHEPDRDTFDVVVFGDSRPGKEALTPEGRGELENIRRVFAAVAASARAWDAALVIHTGDFVRTGDSPEQWALFREIAGDLLGRAFFPVPGNHEYRDARETLDTYFEHFGERLGGAYHAYSGRLGRTLFVFLDSNRPLGPGSSQRAWLDGLLEQARAPAVANLVVTAHHPFLTTGKHRVKPHTIELLEALIAHKQEAGLANLVLLGGHAHMYERFEPETEGSGVLVVVVGAGGASSHEADVHPHDQIEVPGFGRIVRRAVLDGRDPDPYAYCRLSVDGDRVTLALQRLDEPR